MTSTPNIEHCPQCDLPMLHYPAKDGLPERYWCPLDNYEIVDRTNLPMARVSMAESDFDRGSHLLGYFVGTTEHDTVMRMTLGDVEGSLHATKDQAEAELVQVWAEGYDDHEIFEVRAFRKVD